VAGHPEQRAKHDEAPITDSPWRDLPNKIRSVHDLPQSFRSLATNWRLGFNPYLYSARKRVERFFNKIKQCRRVATRYDKLAANYLAFVQLASIRLWLRANEYAP
jgi:transposase